MEEVEVLVTKNEGIENSIWDSQVLGSPYQVCEACSHRLRSLALRPREFFNLTAIHGPYFYLHDDFYDFETGEATQPDIPIEDTALYPFPTLHDAQQNLNTLLDYAFVQYFTSTEVLDLLRTFKKEGILHRIQEKVNYNQAITDKAYTLVAQLVGRVAENWAKEEWKNRNTSYPIGYYAELLSACLDPNEAFKIITQELSNLEGNSFNENSLALIHLKSTLVLDWIEQEKHKMVHFTTQFGMLAASSNFSWERAKKWLEQGRPLNLIALDALNFCTLNSYRGQSLWMKTLQPKLTDSFDTSEMISTLKNHVEKDSVPRVKNTVRNILQNLAMED